MKGVISRVRFLDVLFEGGEEVLSCYLVLSVYWAEGFYIRVCQRISRTHEQKRE